MGSSTKITSVLTNFYFACRFLPSCFCKPQFGEPFLQMIVLLEIYLGAHQTNGLDSSIVQLRLHEATLKGWPPFLLWKRWKNFRCSIALHKRPRHPHCPQLSHLLKKHQVTNWWASVPTAVKIMLRSLQNSQFMSEPRWFFYRRLV